MPRSADIALQAPAAALAALLACGLAPTPAAGISTTTTAMPAPTCDAYSFDATDTSGMTMMPGGSAAFWPNLNAVVLRGQSGSFDSSLSIGIDGVAPEEDVELCVMMSAVRLRAGDSCLLEASTRCGEWQDVLTLTQAGQGSPVIEKLILPNDLHGDGTGCDHDLELRLVNKGDDGREACALHDVIVTCPDAPTCRGYHSMLSDQRDLLDWPLDEGEGSVSLSDPHGMRLLLPQGRTFASATNTISSIHVSSPVAIEATMMRNGPGECALQAMFGGGTSWTDVVRVTGADAPVTPKTGSAEVDIGEFLESFALRGRALDGYGSEDLVLRVVAESPSAEGVRCFLQSVHVDCVDEDTTTPPGPLPGVSIEVDVAGTLSRYNKGVTGNEVKEVDVSGLGMAAPCLTAVAYDTTVDSIFPSWNSELRIGFSNGVGGDFHVQAGSISSGGTFSQSDTIFGKALPLFGGEVFLEFWESFDDGGLDPDAVYETGSTVTLFIDDGCPATTEGPASYSYYYSYYYYSYYSY